MPSNSSPSPPPPPHHRHPPGLGRHERDDERRDRAVKSTADDAVLHKSSCVERGYYDDPFVRDMSRGASGLVHGKKKSSSATQPIIRRGTHARVKAMDRAIGAFLSLPISTSVRQVVVMGSGRDTTYLRHRFGNEPPMVDGRAVRWYEVDHPSVMIQKAHGWLPGCIPRGYSCECHANEETGTSYAVTIAPSQTTGTSVIDIGDGSSDSHKGTTSNFHLVGHDLRSSPAALFETLRHPKHGYDASAPTLFVFECVLMYLPEESTRDLLRYIAESPSSSSSDCGDDPFVAVVIYDPIPSNDRFGRLMIDNLQRAGITGRRGGSRRRTTTNETDDDDDPQLSLEKTQTLSDQLAKLIESGFDMAVGCDMMAAYDHGVLSAEDRRRAARCEMLDELEEFNLLMKHYCLVVGVASSFAKRKRTRGGEEDVGRTSAVDSVGFKLCSIGEDSTMGFREGHCMAVPR